MTPKRITMANTGEKLPNGEAVREFYSSLDMIEDYYWNKGYRKKAYLYRTLKEKLGWRMSLESFKYHFKRAIESNANSRSQSSTSERSPTPEVKDSTSEPIILDTAKQSEKVVYNGGTKNIERDEI